MEELLSDAGRRDALSPHLFAAADCAPHMPAMVGDDTDFYVGIHHAMNVGKQFQPDHPLLPNCKYAPIGYHGRASSLRPSDCGEWIVLKIKIGPAIKSGAIAQACFLTSRNA